MKHKHFTISSCSQCPFENGGGMSYKCGLILFLGKESNIITKNVYAKLRPRWCPLNKHEYNFKNNKGDKK